jgi:hypothetical protein
MAIAGRMRDGERADRGEEETRSDAAQDRDTSRPRTGWVGDLRADRCGRPV